MKGQSSLELMITVGIVIAFTIPVLFLLLSATSIGYEDTAKAQADASSRTLSDTMNSVYSQGPGAKRLILLNVPASTHEIYASDGEVVVVVKLGSGQFDAASPTIASISGDSSTLGTKTGLILVSVEADEVTGEVRLVDPTES
ncbi:hypothetical protein KKE92_04640 [Candidatus Micrarchaeota archaeon]|nr:hypothetical protein [Candidatus Micrarchaeota archaeon]MBU1681744.1 hypothetical protein [Candidatus Micrarchaeota archaeon]